MTTYPHYTEYASTAPNPPYNQVPVGCVVSATADVILAYTGYHTPDLTALGIAMGAKCRAHFGTRHGLWLQGVNWGPCCAYLEIQSRGIRVSYTRLSVSALRANLQARKPTIIAGLYVSFPLVSASSYSATTPARGRSDSYTGAHGVVLWEFGTAGYVLSDADFGSPGRPVVPPYSLVKASSVEGMYASRTWPAAVCLDPRPTPPQYKVVVPAQAIWVYSLLPGDVFRLGDAWRRPVPFIRPSEAPCTPPRWIPPSNRHPGKSLVQITAGGLKGQYMAATYAHTY